MVNDFKIPRERPQTFMDMTGVIFDNLAKTVKEQEAASKEEEEAYAEVDNQIANDTFKESQQYKESKEVHVHVYLPSLAAKDPDAKVRNRGKVVFPAGSKKVKDDKDHFPINSANQARNALSRVAQYSSVPSWYDGTLEELKKKVRGAVKRVYPSIKVSDD